MWDLKKKTNSKRVKLWQNGKAEEKKLHFCPKWFEWKTVTPTCEK